MQVDLLQSKTYSHRKRLVGGFYAYEHATETKRLQTLCEGKTNAKGLLLCDKISPASGNLILQAVTRDSAGREAAANCPVWVAGKEDWWFRAEDSDRIDVIPEARRYEPGEKARLQVRMPFRKATALISVEREGVAEAFVRELSGKEPVIEIPVRGEFAPNIFISVLVVRGRVGDVRPTATVDLGRPGVQAGHRAIQSRVARPRAAGQGRRRQTRVQGARKGTRFDRRHDGGRRRPCRAAPKWPWPQSTRACSN